MSDRSISDQITRAMQQYSAEVSKDIENALSAVADETRDRLRSTSPRRTGRYARGWRITKKAGDGTINLTVCQTAKNAPLTHLLENGHRSKRGLVKAQPHIADAEAWAADQTVKAIERAVKK